MNFDKPMIDLVQEIRRRATSEDKPSIKLANPELLNELIPIYQASNDTILKTLVKELFHKAGNQWPDLLETGTKETQRLISKVYRGQIQVLASEQSMPQDSAKNRPKRMYRGQIVA